MSIARSCAWVVGIGLAGCALWMPVQAGESWSHVKDGKQGGISGMVALGKDQFLIVHDNKKPEQDRLAIVELKAKSSGSKYRVVPWPKGARMPTDLEAITAVPGDPARRFLAMESDGNVTEIELAEDHKSIKVIRAFSVPVGRGGDDGELLTLYKAGTRLIALWGTRGQNETPAQLHWGVWDPATGSFSGVNTASISVPWPTHDVRHMSDICVDAGGNVTISSASDAGDDGPFSGALYRIGAIAPAGADDATLILEAKPVELLRTDKYKIEGIAPVSGGFALGSDDENRGAYACIAAVGAKSSATR